MEITIESINEKLGFDFRTWNPDNKDHLHDDGQNDPFRVLSTDELDFIIKYFNNVA